MAGKMSPEELAAFLALSAEERKTHILTRYRQALAEVGLPEDLQSELVGLMEAYLSAPPIEEEVTLVLTRKEGAHLRKALSSALAATSNTERGQEHAKVLWALAGRVDEVFGPENWRHLND